jgi:hypothetical protein
MVQAAGSRMRTAPGHRDGRLAAQAGGAKTDGGRAGFLSPALFVAGTPAACCLTLKRSGNHHADLCDFWSFDQGAIARVHGVGGSDAEFERASAPATSAADVPNRCWPAAPRDAACSLVHNRPAAAAAKRVGRDAADSNGTG